MTMKRRELFALAALGSLSAIVAADPAAAQPAPSSGNAISPRGNVDLRAMSWATKAIDLPGWAPSESDRDSENKPPSQSGGAFTQSQEQAWALKSALRKEEQEGLLAAYLWVHRLTHHGSAINNGYHFEMALHHYEPRPWQDSTVKTVRGIQRPTEQQFHFPADPNLLFPAMFNGQFPKEGGSWVSPEAKLQYRVQDLSPGGYDAGSISAGVTALLLYNRA